MEIFETVEKIPRNTEARTRDVSGLRRARWERNWTLEDALTEIASRFPEDSSGLTPSTLSGWELGKNRTSRRFRRIFCEIYGKDSDTLFSHQDMLQPVNTTNTVSARTGWFKSGGTNSPLCMAICGSRATGVDNAAIDEAVVSLSRLLMHRECKINHGPVGIGIETMTYIADHYRPPELQMTVGIFGRANVIRDADIVVFVGGGRGTLDEIDLACAMRKQIIPFPASGGAARVAFDRLRSDTNLQDRLPEGSLARLEDCGSAEFAKVVEHAVLQRDL